MNLGIAGDTTSGLLVRFQTEVLPLKPQMVFIMGGYNDIFSTQSDLNARGNVMAIVHQAYAKGIVPILGIPPQIMGTVARPEWAELFDFDKAVELGKAYCKWLRKFCQTFRVSTVDFEQEFAYRVQYGANGVGYLDGLHPNHRGQDAMAEIFCDAVETIGITQKRT